MTRLQDRSRLPATRSIGRCRASPRRGSGAATSSPRCCGGSEFKYVCVNPGSSFRGLHDSLVNYLGNDNIKLMLALHEQSVVAIAHGYAKVTGEPMAVVVHSNVGLMCGLMSVFNAWCDRVPILMLGADGRGGLRRAAKLDRLVPYLSRPGCAGAPSRQMGRAAGVVRKLRWQHVARVSGRLHRASRPVLCDP